MTRNDLVQANFGHTFQDQLRMLSAVQFVDKQLADRSLEEERKAKKKEKKKEKKVGLAAHQ